MNLPQEEACGRTDNRTVIIPQKSGADRLAPAPDDNSVRINSSTRRIIAVDGKVKLPERIVTTGIFGARRHLNLVAVTFANPLGVMIVTTLVGAETASMVG